MSNIDSGIISNFQENFDEIQKIIYGTQENINDEKKTAAESVHVYQFTRTTWYNKVPRIIPGSGDSDSAEKKYKLNNSKHDLLAYNTFKQILPIVRVRKEYERKIQICWIKDLGFNILESGQLHYGDDRIACMDSKSIKIDYTLLNKNSDYKFIDSQIGNIPELQNWNITLHSRTVKFELPWYYSKDFTLGLPLYYSCMDKNFYHTYTFNNKLTNLLRMRVLDEHVPNKYIIMPVDLKYLHVEGRIETLKSPEILGMFIKLLPDEVDSYKCWTRENKYGDFYIEDITSKTSDNPSKYGSKLSVDVNENAIAHTMIWMAENKSATDLGIIGNYTTNTLNSSQGYDPIENTTLHVGPHDYFKDLSGDYTGNLFYRDFPGKTIIPGFHVWSFCRNPLSINAKIGINMSKLNTKLTISLKDKNPNLRTLDSETGNVIESKSDDVPEFLLHVYLMVTRKISFFGDPKDTDKWFIKFDSDLYRENLELRGEPIMANHK